MTWFEIVWVLTGLTLMGFGIWMFTDAVKLHREHRRKFGSWW